MIEQDAIWLGQMKPKGRQGQGHSHNLDESRVAECQPYSGAKIPLNPTYLTVELKIKMLNLGSEEKGFKKCVYRKLRTPHSLDAKGFGKRNRENAIELIRLLSERIK